jgi:hypothetical protein
VPAAGDTMTRQVPGGTLPRDLSKKVIDVHHTSYSCLIHTRQLTPWSTATPPTGGPGAVMASRTDIQGLQITVMATRLNAASPAAIVTAGRGVAVRTTSSARSATAAAYAVPSRSDVQSQVRNEVSGKSKAM